MSRESYKVITKDGIGEIVEKKSRFIGAVYNVESTEEAEAKIAEISKKYWDARHNCYAYVIGENSEISKCSDNGEPSGTAGKPILEVINGAGITNALIIVTRYFGGTLLGKGGLKRAYTDSGRLALEDGEPVTLIPALRWKERCSYSVFEMLSRKAGQSGWQIGNIEYGQDVAFEITVPKENENELVRYCLDLSGGALVPGDPESILMTGERVSLT